MTSAALFLIGLALTLATALAIVAYIKDPLHSLLIELCGNRERAIFWVTFSNVTLALLPVIFAMQCTPDTAPGTSIVLEVASQLKWALTGLLGAMVVLGWMLSRSIHRHEVSGNQAPQKAD